MTNAMALVEGLRTALSFGERVGEVTTVQHPKSGERYAVVVSEGRILWAAGPLGMDDDPQGFIDNQFSGQMVEDADWLTQELA